MKSILIAKDDVNYSYSVFEGNNIRGYNFWGFHGLPGITDISINGCDLSDVNIKTTQLSDLKVKDSHIRNSGFDSVRFKRCNFNGVTFGNIRFDSCEFIDCIFTDCEFYRCNFQDSILYEGLFKNCNFSYDNLFIRQVCPEKGSYTAYKKAYAHITLTNKLTTKEYPFYFINTDIPVIVELKITEDSKRSSATSKKCRASKCEVLSITDIYNHVHYNKAYSKYDNTFVYEVGKTIEVTDFDDNRWKECSTGIHHFLNRDDAVYY